ncbi:hypothetical protein FACS1894178_6340 [Bacteroidia bacterium]|nr:hypothetical protein FACS1894178_6340 [Bacteroidia bacterium]
MKVKNFLKFGVASLCLATAIFSACRKPVEVTGVSLNTPTLSLGVGTSGQLTATVAPSDAADKSVTWASSNTAVATVADGNVTAVAIGEATITVTTADGGKTATCEITVNDPLTYDEGVIINGVKWATHNVDAVGTFASAPEGTGMFYQWNRKVAWAATGDVTGWDTSNPEGETWEKANDPSPAGWRVPTYDELRTLLDAEKVSSEWTILNGVNGRKFTDIATGNSLFLPAAGYRYWSDGSLRYVGTSGYCWSSMRGPGGSEYAYYFRFSSSDVDMGNSYRKFGRPIRCVAE